MWRLSTRKPGKLGRALTYSNFEYFSSQLLEGISSSSGSSSGSNLRVIVEYSPGKLENICFLGEIVSKDWEWFFKKLFLTKKKLTEMLPMLQSADEYVNWSLAPILWISLIHSALCIHFWVLTWILTFKKVHIFKKFTNLFWR